MNKNCSVLVADDDDEVRTTIAEILELEGWSVTQARDGCEATEKARHLRPDVLLIDQRMPGLLGTQVVERLRAEGVGGAIILITAAHGAGQLATKLGIHHLSKPFGLDELLAAVSVHC